MNIKKKILKNMKEAEKSLSLITEALSAIAETQEYIEEIKFDLEEKEGQIIRDNDPKELGSNEAQRTARINAMTEIERKKLKDWQIQLIKEKAILEILNKRFQFHQLAQKSLTPLLKG
jgi:hypothetical protein